jgi:hypothetical protein
VATAAGAEPNVPAGHKRGAEAPAKVYCPATTATHAADAVAPTAALNVPAEHATHAATAEAPVVVKYVPAGHGVGVPVPGTGQN